MGYPFRLARMPDANNGDVALTEFGVPVLADEAGSTIAANRLFGAAAVVLYGPNGQVISASSPLSVSAAVTANPTSGTGTWSSAPSATTAATILAPNTGRHGASVYNNSTANLFLLLSATGTVASGGPFTIKMVPASYFEVPFGYTGVIKGIWDAVNGAAEVTEYTT